MKHSVANAVVEGLRKDTRLYLPALTKRRGFSSSRVEHLLNRLVAQMPVDEAYLEVGTLEGRTLDAAAKGNAEKTLIGCDPCEKYEMAPEGLPANVAFYRCGWQTLLSRPMEKPIGLAFYDGDHSAGETADFLLSMVIYGADEAVIVLDDWDRESVREGAFRVVDPRFRLLRECPEYTGGLTGPPHHFGYAFGVALFGFKREGQRGLPLG